MINASLKELSAALADKRISSVELTQLYLDRIARHHANQTKRQQRQAEKGRDEDG